MMNDSSSLVDKGLFILVATYAFTALISTAASYIVESIGLILLLISYKHWPDLWRGNKALLVGIAAYVLGHFVTSLTAVNKVLALETTKGQMEPMMLLFMVLAVKWNKRRVMVIMSLLAAGLFVNDCYAFYQWIFLDNDRPAGFAKQAAVLFSEYIGLLLPMIYFVFVRAKNRITIIVSAILFLFTGTLMIADSVKMIWIVAISAVVAFSLYFLFFSKGESIRRILIVPALVVVMAGAVMFSPIVQERIALAVNTPSSFLHTRMILWDIGERIFYEHKLVGIGPGNYGPEKYYYLDMFHSGAYFNRNIINSHNIIVQTAAEQGVVGLMALVMLIGGIGYSAWRFLKMQLACFGVGIIILTGCLLVAGMSEYTMGYKPLMRLYWFLLGMLIIAAQFDSSNCFKKECFRA